MEDNRAVEPAFSSFVNLAATYKVDVLVHEAARDDLCRDADVVRRRISLSKLEKFPLLAKVRDLTASELEEEFGPLPRANDLVDATLLHALRIGAADFLVTQDRRLHDRARRHSAELGRRILYVADAVQLLRTTYEPVDAPVRFVEDVQANSIPLADSIFDSLREDYDGFDLWWTEKCVRQRRQCWIVEDEGIAGLLVRKDETGSDTDASQKLAKILKICTFEDMHFQGETREARPKNRRTSPKESVLVCSAQPLRPNLCHDFRRPISLIDLLEYYGFVHTYTKDDGERVYEKFMSGAPVTSIVGQSRFDAHRINYPRFVLAQDTSAFGIPIKEGYHDVLFPDLRQLKQMDLFDPSGRGKGPRRPGNTIRKVYLCRAPSNLAEPGSILLFYKGKSLLQPSQAVTALGVLEDLQLAHSTKELLQLTGGRSVYSERDIETWNASNKSPVKVINFLLAAYIEPPLSLRDLRLLGVFEEHPPQSIFRIDPLSLRRLFSKIDLGFRTV